MFDTHGETLYVWVALGAMSVAVLGVVTSLPSTAPPDAARVAGTIDEVATSPPGSVADRQITADSWRLADGQLRLRNDGGSVQAPVRETVLPSRSDRLRRVLDGRPPSAVYDSPAAFQRALDRSAGGHEVWRPAPATLSGRLTWFRSGSRLPVSPNPTASTTLSVPHRRGLR